MTKQEAAAAQARCDATNAYALVDLSIIRSRSDMDFDNHSREDIRALLADRAALIEVLRPFATDAPRLVYRIAALRSDCEAAVALLKSLGEMEEK